MKTILLKFALGFSAFVLLFFAKAQDKKPSTSSKDSAEIKENKPQNLMLNASNDNGPRNVNIGLPASIGGTTILENGLPVVYSFYGESPTLLWRSSNSFDKVSVLSVAQTAVTIGDVGVSLSTFTSKGTAKQQGTLTLNTNSFGLIRGDLTLSGPLGKNFFYSANIYGNLDPGTFKTPFTDYLDQFQSYKLFINKKFNNNKGEMGIQLKYTDYAGITSKQSPYIYTQSGKVYQFADFVIGRKSYLESSGIAHVINPLNGLAENWSQMKDMGATNFVIDILGNNKLKKGFTFNYALRLNFANAGLYNPYYTSLSQIDPTKTRYFYPSTNQPYTNSYAQSVLSISTPKTSFTTFLSKFEISKKTDKHNFYIGLNEWFYNMSDNAAATYSLYQEVGNNPKQLIRENSIDGGVTWTRNPTTDAYGGVGFNAAMQYYSGKENKLAAYFNDIWTVSKKIILNTGLRLEWQSINGLWYPDANRLAAPSLTWVSGTKEKVSKNWFNNTIYLSATYKMTKKMGILADLAYTQVNGNLSNYSGADNPQIEPSKIPSASLGIYINTPLISIVSKGTYIERTNFKNNSTFGNGYKKTITYNISTMGWTTDLEVKPSKAFKVHLLVTLQKPTYKNFIIDLNAANLGYFDLSGGLARSVSKTIVELDPSYTYKAWRFWLSARYFSQEAANYPNTLFFAGRWETFGGINFKYKKKLDLNLNIINILGQSGAQGSISGTNTTTAAQAIAFYNQPLAGTYIRPFTVELGAVIRF